MNPSSNHRDEEHQAQWVVFTPKKSKQQPSVPIDMVTHLTFDPSTRIIPEYALTGRTSLQQVKIPSTVRKIHNQAFAVCLNLTTATFEDGLQTIGELAFDHCSALEEAILPNTVIDIGMAAFHLCQSLSQVHLPSRLKTIRKSTFWSCSMLVEINLPDGLLRIEKNAFGACESLARVKIPNSVWVIMDSAFEGCSALTVVLEAQGLKKLGCRVFAGCNNLLASTEDGSDRFQLPSGLKCLKSSTFGLCTMLVEVHIPRGLSSIESFCFYRCSSLRTVLIPDTVSWIGKFAFGQCSSLPFVDLPKGLKKILGGTFYGCNSLTGIVLPSSLEEIHIQAFADCLRLMCVEFPEGSHVMIYPEAFTRCPSLVNLSIAEEIDCEKADSLFAKCMGKSRRSSSSLQADIEPFSALVQLSGHNGHEHLRERFAKLPIHSLCYHASVTNLDALRQALEASTKSLEWRDQLGMTPFHIVASSANPRVDILECLLGKYPVELLTQMDNRGNAMMDYLLLNARGIPVLQLVLRVVFGQAPLPKHLEPRKTMNLDLKDQIDSLAEHTDTKSRIVCVRQIFERVGFHMQSESTALLELAVWKRRIVDVQNGSNKGSMDREACRYQCGAQVVIENVTGFWGREESNYCESALSVFPFCKLIRHYQVGNQEED